VGSVTGPRALPAFLLEDSLEDSAWRAALHVLDAPMFTRDQRVWRHVDLDPIEPWIDFPAILAEGWSPAVAALLVAAAHLWADAATVDQLPPLDLGDLVARLDDGNWQRLLGALAIRRAGLRGSARPLVLPGLLEGR
jgi:hypothetical protein